MNHPIFFFFFFAMLSAIILERCSDVTVTVQYCSRRKLRPGVLVREGVGQLLEVVAGLCLVSRLDVFLRWLSGVPI